MPGLNQLKQFTSDILNVGDEPKIRAQRGEKPSAIKLPEGISEADDSEDFVLGLPEQASAENAEGQEGSEDAENTDAPEIDLNAADSSEGGALPPDLEALLNPVSAGNAAEVPDLSAFLDEPAAPEEPPEETPLEDLDLEALLKPSEPVEETPAVEEEKPSQPVDFGDLGDLASFDADAFSTPAGNSFDAPAADNFEAPSAESIETPSVNDDFDFPASSQASDDFAFDGNIIDLNEDIPEDIAEEDGSMPEMEAEAPVAAEAPAAEAPAAAEENAFDAPVASDEFAVPDFDQGSADFNSGSDALSPMDEFAVPDFDAMPSDSGSGTAAEAILSENALPVDATMDVPAEDFDMSDALEGMGETGDIDFGSSDGSGDEFPVTEAGPKQDDDFLLDEENFEIPGFSDTSTAAFDKKGRPKVDTVDFSKAPGAKPKNTLTDEEYEVFRKNLAAYPLNLRLAVEDLIVKDEFTDDAVFEVVEKILKKASARQVATHIEKMLDITIDVPRDYERRSVVQYEAYKQSFQYQLKNRIIPGGIAAAVLAVIGYLLFQAAVMFVYKPTMATMLYKQGYALLQNNEYPQSESRFLDAVKYKPIKKWFFKYANGYREHKQFERAGQMYRNILAYFNHDKNGGLEWAEMELYERSNYERAEKIIRREILDYHINDADGLLLLGDVFLEWGEIDPSKYESAREHYSDLLNLYGANETYMSRMMRYFIRTDKLRNVLEMKNRFYPNKKSLCAEDWTELSGYLLDKLYGPLSRSDEYLRSQIEDLRAMLEIAEKADSSIPAAHYNMARYFNHNGNFDAARKELKLALDCFDKLKIRTRKNTYKEIDTCRLLGELYADIREYLKAQEVYTRGIDLYQTEHELNGFEGDKNTGRLYADMGDIEYFISGDMDAALKDYEQAIINKNDTDSLNFRVGVIRYNKQEYDLALASFIKAAETNDSDMNLMLSLGNVLALRGDNFAAQGYYSHLLGVLDKEKARHYMLVPQEKDDDNRLVEMYLKANNNLGVTLYKIARQTGDSSKNAESLVRLSDSIRAWDALTRNPETMVRLGGSNLALQNSKYITTSRASFEPAIYTDIPRTLTAEKTLK